jgi:hypothetical protein
VQRVLVLAGRQGGHNVLRQMVCNPSVLSDDGGEVLQIYFWGFGIRGLDLFVQVCFSAP